MRFSLLVSVGSSIIALTVAIAPYLVEWNTTRSYGPDGPWPVVTVQVGTSKDNEILSWLDLHPGGIWQSMLLIEAFCSSTGVSNPCLAGKGGLYNINDSTTVVENFTNEDAWVWQ